MTIPFTTVFTRIGKLAKSLSNTNTFQGTTLPADVSALVGLYTSGDETIIDGIQSQLSSAQSSGLGWANYLSSAASTTVNQAVYLDNPQSSRTNLKISLTELIRQMKANSQSVQSAAQTSSVAFTGSGNGVCVVSCKDANGLATEYMNSEAVKVSCTSDASSGSTVGNEGFQALGQVASSNGALAWDWPQGSGASLTLSAVNAAANPGQQGQLLTNGDFETFSANVPAGWAISVGTAGTTVFKSTSPFYTGLACLKITGNGSELTSLSQQFGISTGTTQTLKGGTQYAFSFWVQMSAVPTAGVLSIELVDGSGTVLQDVSGTNNAVTQSLPALTTSWTNLSGTFRTPHALPATYKLRLRLTTALDSGKSLYLDRLGFAAMAQLYSGGPSLNVFSGSSQFFVGDYFTVTTTNAHPLLSLQRVAQRFFNMPSLGLVLPSSGSPTQADTLIA